MYLIIDLDDLALKLVNDIIGILVTAKPVLQPSEADSLENAHAQYDQIAIDVAHVELPARLGVSLAIIAFVIDAAEEHVIDNRQYLVLEFGLLILVGDEFKDAEELRREYDDQGQYDEEKLIVPSDATLLENSLIDAHAKFASHLNQVCVFELHDHEALLLVFLLIRCRVGLGLQRCNLLPLGIFQFRYFVADSDVEDYEGQKVETIDEIQPPIEREDEYHKVQNHVIEVCIQVQDRPEAPGGVGEELGRKPNPVVLNADFSFPQV